MFLDWRKFGAQNIRFFSYIFFVSFLQSFCVKIQATEGKSNFWVLIVYLQGILRVFLLKFCILVVFLTITATFCNSNFENIYALFWRKFVKPEIRLCKVLECLLMGIEYLVLQFTWGRTFSHIILTGEFPISPLGEISLLSLAPVKLSLPKRVALFLAI